ncbi:hypothetical protein EJ02DRAFT_439768 [Clathrospora elynae]|uniref:Uncharacterized protein n=1 Tax=Clathrospora elynae TaxID=706981 RepID=A0A6A5S521_9PLEO|nr:hypothetical protein EJ02DRAFT_439768 [Clathrospora elynae]
MEIEAPTFNSLNKPQKRALILRDQLRFVEPRHLDTFIEGLTNDEPPTYRKINGVIQPPLNLVTFKDNATRFDLGNVLFPDENNAVHRVYLVVEDDQIQMRAEEALPLDCANLDSVAIHGFIAGTMVPMFKEKFRAIFAKMNKINEARRAAHSMPNLVQMQFEEGETLSRLDPSKSEQNGDARLRRTRKREPNETVLQHTSNKRRRTGLDTIPEDAKRDTFDTIPAHVKVDLFNSIVKTAFPNFDNLMVASWNVISVYSACGSDFPEMHRAVVDLKGVLQDFDEAFGQRVDRATPSYRNDFGGPPQQSRNGDRLPSPLLTFPQDGAGAADLANGSAVNGSAQRQDDLEAAVEAPEDVEDRTQPEMPPPRVQQVTQSPEDLGEEKKDEEQEDEVPYLNPRLNGRPDRHNSVHQPSLRHMAENHINNSVPSLTSDSSPQQQNAQFPPRERTKIPRDQPADPTPEDKQAATPELARRREEYASSIGKASALANLQGSGTASSTNKPHRTAAAAADETDSELEQQHPQLHEPTTRAPTPTPKRKKLLSDYTTPQLVEKFLGRKNWIIRSFGSLASAPQYHISQLNILENALKTRELQADAQEKVRRGGGAGTSGNGMFGSYLGNSVLGAKKSMGMAPVANMFPVRKDGGGDRNEGGGGGGGGGRQRKGTPGANGSARRGH